MFVNRINKRSKGEKSMKKLVKLFSLTMAMLMVFALFAACGKTEDDQTTSGGEGQTASGRTAHAASL